METITIMLERLKELIQRSTDKRNKEEMQRIIDHFQASQLSSRSFEAVIVEGILLIGEVREVIQDENWRGWRFFLTPKIAPELDDFAKAMLAAHIINPLFTAREQQEFNEKFIIRSQSPYAEQEKTWENDRRSLRKVCSACEADLIFNEGEYKFWCHIAPGDIDKVITLNSRQLNDPEQKAHIDFRKKMFQEMRGQNVDNPALCLAEMYKEEVQTSNIELESKRALLHSIETKLDQYRKNTDYFFTILYKVIWKAAPIQNVFS